MARPTRRTVLAPKRRIAAALRGAASSPDAPSAPVPLRLVRRSRAALLRATALQGCAALVLALPAVAQPAPNARPTGGQVVAGSASIRQDAAQTTITQSSQRAAVDWKSFDVGSQQTVRFQQPSASAVTLNRVTGPDPSQIAGRIQANGQVVLTNPSGVTFARGAQVDTAGLIVSAAGISNQNFMAGRMIFDQPARRDAAIVNQGTLTVRQAGLAALVAPQVRNTGTITARLGHVVLAGARAATLDLYGDGLVAIDVTRQVTETPRGADGKPVTSLVTNSGVVRASGGTVQLTASAVDGVVTTLVTAGGSIAAATRAGRPGTIAIGGLGGNVVVTGTLAAEGTRAGTRGGAVEVTATGSVTVASGARVLASGRAGGGTVAIGTTLPRARSLGPTGASVATPAAAATTIEPGARIAADAGTSGNGGRVAILSAGRTRMDGAISARGGTSGGEGGLVEVSG
ncbi:MAG: filamentous hemagglutinin N-terminal domain-containing protein, partial [Rhodospirillales bacterium]|nr:filamentous hemagglutinin N-terminal domain-containing protein [Rhodospirillales bacterium]